MYTRTYNDDRRAILIPDSYGGTALSEGIGAESHEDKGKNPWEGETAKASAEPTETDDKETFSAVQKPQMPSFLTNIFKNSSFSLQKIGTEEILILATAVFLLFSKEGDKECAIMLLLLLFLT